MRILKKSLKPSSKEWLRRHLTDHYVKKSYVLEYRSRAAFKLLEIDAKYKFLHKARNIADLGCAPGGWAQVLIEKCKNRGGRIVGVDLLNVANIQGMHFILGDFNDDSVQRQILNHMMEDEHRGSDQDRNSLHIIESQTTPEQQLKKVRCLDLVVSDISPSMTGNRDVDRCRMRNVVDSIIDFSCENLIAGGVMLFKYFRYDETLVIATFKDRFNETKIIKPPASRSESSETYILALGFKL
jgi:23S rRNA (uridine2552-2'-O)-methyltransferase